jgi:hypothetical protein
MMGVLRSNGLDIDVHGNLLFNCFFLLLFRRIATDSVVAVVAIILFYLDIRLAGAVVFFSVAFSFLRLLSSPWPQWYQCLSVFYTNVMKFQWPVPLL